MSEDLNDLVASLNVPDHINSLSYSLYDRLTQVDGQLQTIAQSIQSISGPVKELEVQRTNARLALTYVNDIIEFHTKFRELTLAVKTDNLPIAALLCGQISDLPVRFSFDEMNEFNMVKLEVCEKVKKTFGSALSENNKSIIEQYAGLFHHLQLGREGIESYIKYITDSLRIQFDSILSLLPSTGNYEDSLIKIYRLTVKQYESQYENITKEFGISGTLELLQQLQSAVDDFAVTIIAQYLQVVNSKFKSQSLCEEMTKIIKHSESFEIYMQKLGKQLVMNGAKSNGDDKNKQTGLAKLSVLKAKIMELADLYISVETQFMTDGVAACFEKFQISPAAEALAKEKGPLVSGVLFERLDDSFFTIQNACSRVMSTFNLNSVCAFLNNVALLISETVIAALASKIPHLKPTWSGQSSQENTKYILLLNLIITTRKCINRMVTNLELQFSKIFGDSKGDLAMFQNCMGSISESEKHCQDLLDRMLSTLGKSLNFPQLLAGLKVLSFEISLEQHSDFEVNDPFALSFMKDLKLLLKQWNSQLSLDNFEALVEVSAVELSAFIEKEVKNKKFNELGALQFQKDIREIIAQVQSMSQKPLRHRFIRLKQISELLLAIDEGEVKMLVNDPEWKLTERESKAFRTLRVG
jgi:hypothetical protein